MDTTNPHSRAEKIAANVINRYIEIGTIDASLRDGINRSIDMLPCSLETLSDSQIVDIISRLVTTHFTAYKFAQTKYDLPEPYIAKLTKLIIESIDS